MAIVDAAASAVTTILLRYKSSQVHICYLDFRAFQGFDFADVGIEIIDISKNDFSKTRREKEKVYTLLGFGETAP